MLTESDQLHSVAIDLSTPSPSYSQISVTTSRRNNNNTQSSDTNSRAQRGEDDESSQKKNGFFRRHSKKISMLWNDRNCRPLFLYTTLATLLAIVSIVYGSITSSIALDVNGIKVLFNSLSMLILLNSMVMPRMYKSSTTYSYGFERYEVLFSFSLGVFLVFISLFTFFEAFERLFAPVKPEFSPALLTFFGLSHVGINLFAVLFFRKYLSMRTVKEMRFARDDQTPLAVVITTECLSTAAIFVSSWSTGSELWSLLDCIGGIVVIAVMLASEAIPLCYETGRVLLNTTPLNLKDALDKCIREASTVPGVLECANEHFWTLAPGLYIGTLTVRARSDANEQQVLAKVSHVYQSVPWDLKANKPLDIFALDSADNDPDRERRMANSD